MASYLDKTGLTTLWSKMKSHVSSNYLSLQGGAVTGNISATSYSGSWGGNTIPISKGGTGATTRAGGFENLYLIGGNPISSTTNDTTAKWAEIGCGLAWYGTEGYLIDQPGQYGALANFNATGSEIQQLWFTAPGGAVYHRGGNASGWFKTWIKFYDTENKPTPAEIGAAAASHTHSYLPLSGGTLTGPLTLAYTDGLKTNSSDGWKTDSYGSFVHMSTNTNNYWCIKSNAESVVFKVWYESGNVDIGGTLSTASSATIGSYLTVNGEASIGSTLTIHGQVNATIANDAYTIMYVNRENGASVFWLQASPTNGNMQFLQKHPSCDYSEQYAFPAASSTLTAKASYTILTTKNTVTVAQGGTGLTASPSMLVNLGSTSAANILTASPRPGITGTLSLAHGGTGATSRAGAMTNVSFAGPKPINATANDTPSGWSSVGTGWSWYDTSGLLNYQPSQWGILLHYIYGSDTFQLWCSQNAGPLYYRSGNAGGWGRHFTKILDENNYKSTMFEWNSSTATLTIK